MCKPPRWLDNLRSNAAGGFLPQELRLPASSSAPCFACECEAAWFLLQRICSDCCFRRRRKTGSKARQKLQANSRRWSEGRFVWCANTGEMAGTDVGAPASVCAGLKRKPRVTFPSRAGQFPVQRSVDGGLHLNVVRQVAGGACDGERHGALRRVVVLQSIATCKSNQC